MNRALHLRFEKGMVGLSFCDFVGTREEKAKMAEYRKKEWPRRYKVLLNCLHEAQQTSIETLCLHDLGRKCRMVPTCGN